MRPQAEDCGQNSSPFYPLRASVAAAAAASSPNAGVAADAAVELQLAQVYRSLGLSLPRPMPLCSGELAAHLLGVSPRPLPRLARRSRSAPIMGDSGGPSFLPSQPSGGSDDLARAGFDTLVVIEAPTDGPSKAGCPLGCMDDPWPPVPQAHTLCNSECAGGAGP
jgi:hypothetical protein